MTAYSVVSICATVIPTSITAGDVGLDLVPLAGPSYVFVSFTRAHTFGFGHKFIGHVDSSFTGSPTVPLLSRLLW
jgi:hypothetical protein